MIPPHVFVKRLLFEGISFIMLSRLDAYESHVEAQNILSFRGKATVLHLMLGFALQTPKLINQHANFVFVLGLKLQVDQDAVSPALRKASPKNCNQGRCLNK
jgi:hypothetical protein